VSKRVVDGLEVIDVDVENRQMLSALYAQQFRLEPRSSTRSAMVSWFWMQFMRSTILKYRLLATPQRIGVETRITSAPWTTAS